MEEDTKQKTDASETAKKESPSKKKWYIIGVILITAIALGYYFSTKKTEDHTPEITIPDSVATEIDAGTGTGPVAIVNGEEISREAYQSSIKELLTITSRQGYNTTDPAVVSQIRQQALAALINTRILVQNAHTNNVTVTDQEIADEYKLVEEEAGGAEILAEVLADIGLTDAELRKDITEQLMVDKYLQEKTDFRSITISDEEVTAYYENISANDTNVPPLIDVQEELSQQLLVQKQQQHVSTFIQSLRDEAEIETLI